MTLITSTHEKITNIHDIMNIHPRNDFNIIILNDTDRVLYIHQREIGRNIPCNEFQYIGSDDATTCHIILAKCRNTGLMTVAHIDSIETAEDMCQYIDELAQIQNDSNISIEITQTIIDIYIIGGINDDLSKSITSSLYDSLCATKCCCCLQLCLINEQNIRIQNNEEYPRFYGFGFNIKGNQVHNELCWNDPEFGLSLVSHLHFPLRLRGPEYSLRQVRSIYIIDFDGLITLLNGRDSNNHLMIEISEFAYVLRDRNTILYRLNMDDTEMLNIFSSSPRVEPPHFVESLKSMYRFILENFNLKEMFKKRKIMYEYRNGNWIKL